MSQVLSGIKIIDLSRILGGPFCTQTLADFGADVIKVEPPAGDETRSWGPPFTEHTSAYFVGCNRGKRSLALDLSQPEGRTVLLKLLAQADVLIENFKPGTLAKWQLDYERDLKPLFPKLIHCSLTGFGGQGPLGDQPGYDAAVQAWVGMMSVNGHPETGATRVGLPVIDLASGLYAAIAILMAVLERGKSGKGQSVSTSLYSVGMSLMQLHMSNYFVSHKNTVLRGSAHTNICPYDLFKTGQGPIFLAVGNDEQFRKLCAHIRREDLALDPKYQSNAERLAHSHELKVELEAALSRFSASDLARDLLKLGVPCGPVQSVSQAAEHAQTKELGLVKILGQDKTLASPIIMSATPADYNRSAPRLSEHAQEILQLAGYSQAEVRDLADKKIISLP